jgi:hypothetical protein
MGMMGLSPEMVTGMVEGFRQQAQTVVTQIFARFNLVFERQDAHTAELREVRAMLQDISERLEIEPARKGVARLLEYDAPERGEPARHDQ